MMFLFTAEAVGVELGMAAWVDWRCNSHLITNLGTRVVPVHERVIRRIANSEDARAALVEMLKTMKAQDPPQANPNDLAVIDTDRLAQAPILKSQGGDWTVERFWIDLKKGSYSMDCGHRCNYHYSGSFEWKDGHWIASPLHCDWIACEKGSTSFGQGRTSF